MDGAAISRARFLRDAGHAHAHHHRQRFDGRIYFAVVCGAQLRRVRFGGSNQSGRGRAVFGDFQLRWKKRLSRRTYNAPLRLDKVAGLALRTICACAIMGVAGQVGSTLLDGILPTGKLGALVHIVVIGTFGHRRFCALRARVCDSRMELAHQ